MKKLILALLLLGFFTACLPADKEYTHSFINNSSYTVTVTPEIGSDFDSFSLLPGQSKKIVSSDLLLAFSFEPTASVKLDSTSSDNRFVNK
jgi:hypothetical protein